MLGKGLGGIEQAFVDHLTAFDNLGHKSIGIISKGAKIRSKISPKIKIKRIFNFGEWDIFATMRLRKIINKLSPDIIIAHGRRATKLVKRADKSTAIVGVTHSYSMGHLLDLDYVLAITLDLKNNLISLGYDRTKIFHIPNMINVNSVDRDDAASQILFRKQPIIGAMGRFVKKKGFDLFIKALSILKDEHIDFHAVIAGYGEEESNLKALVKTLNLEEFISFPGWVTDKKDFFSSIDIFCLPSIHEPFGIILLEALCHNKPVVSFASEGPREIGSDNENMLFAELGNERDLAEKIKLLLTDKILASKLVSAGRNLVMTKYSSDVVQNALNMAVNQIHAHTTSKVDG